MSDTEDQIAKLEALLTRVRSRSLARPPPPPSERAEAPRQVPPVEAKAASPVPPAPPPAPSSNPPRKRHTSRPEVPVGLFAMASHERYTTTTIEPPRGGASETAPPRGPASDPTLLESPPEATPFADPPPMEVVELEVDPDPSISPPAPAVSGSALVEEGPAGVAAAIPEPLESRSRLVIAPSAFPEGLDDVVEPSGPRGEIEEPFPLATSDPTIKAAPEVAPTGTATEEEEEEEEEAPSSSRRPISLEAKMSEPDDVPTHTPPPASGRIPAASPLDLALEADSVEEETVANAPAVSVVRPEPVRADVAVFVAPTPKETRAKTFGELLDEALSL